MTDTLRPENASPRAGAHRAPKTSSPVRASRASKARDNSRAGVFGVGTRSRSMLARTSAVVVLGAVVGVGLMKPGIPSPEPTVSRFLLDWESKNYLGAAELTTGQPQQVAGAHQPARQAGHGGFRSLHRPGWQRSHLDLRWRLRCQGRPVGLAHSLGAVGHRAANDAE
jgi:hypothetical protein